MNSTPPEPPPTDRRGLLWFAFWFLFVSTPVVVIGLPVLYKHFPQFDVFKDYGLIEAGGALLGGGFTAAFLLARLRSKSTAQIVWRTVGFGLLFTVLFGVISFAGCMWGYRS